jgi:hypothetical protein
MEHLFTDLQVARFNQLSYQTMADRQKRFIKMTNIVAAVAASAAFAGLLRNGGGAGLLVFQILMAIAAVSAAVSPVLGLEDKYSQFSRAAMGHAIAKDRIWALLRHLKLSDFYESHAAREREINAFRDALVVLDERANRSVKKASWEQVERELPAEKAWTII